LAGVKITKYELNFIVTHDKGTTTDALLASMVLQPGIGGSNALETWHSDPK
jgi:hypothetical protein